MDLSLLEISLSRLPTVSKVTCSFREQGGMLVCETHQSNGLIYYDFALDLIIINPQTRLSMKSP